MWQLVGRKNCRESWNSLNIDGLVTHMRERTLTFTQPTPDSVVNEKKGNIWNKKGSELGQFSTPELKFKTIFMRINTTTTLTRHCTHSRCVKQTLKLKLTRRRIWKSCEIKFVEGNPPIFVNVKIKIKKCFETWNLFMRGFCSLNCKTVRSMLNR